MGVLKLKLNLLFFILINNYIISLIVINFTRHSEGVFVTVLLNRLFLSLSVFLIEIQARLN